MIMLIIIVKPCITSLRDGYNGNPADTIYLTKNAFGGEFRVNSKGKWNKAMNCFILKKPYTPPDIMSCHYALQGADIFNRSFEATPIKDNCLYYFDPPYLDTDQSYLDRFTEEQQVQLAEMCKEIDRAGSFFMVSNSPSAEKHYQGFTTHQITAQRTMRVDSNFTTELLITNIKDAETPDNC